jgi:hypothetical protein
MDLFSYRTGLPIVNAYTSYMLTCRICLPVVYAYLSYMLTCRIGPFHLKYTFARRQKTPLRLEMCDHIEQRLAQAPQAYTRDEPLREIVIDATMLVRVLFLGAQLLTCDCQVRELYFPCFLMLVSS